MSRRTFLVTGATGNTGGATLEQMLARGHHVRALAHRQDDRAKRLQGLGAEVVFGDFLNLKDVRAALRGVAGAYFCYPIRPGIIQATAFFAQAAKEAGVECVVNMSQISAREDAKSHAAQDHWLAERVFDWSGLTVVHLRPTYFAEWLLYLAPMIRAGLLHVPFGTGRHAPITAEDQARVIVGILENPSPHGGKAYPLYGPVEFTYQGIADVLNRVRSPFNVSAAAQAAGVAAVEDLEALNRARAHNERWLPWFSARLAALGLRLTPSVANFVLARFPDNSLKNADAAFAFLQSRGILTRKMAAYGLPQHLRITIGTGPEMETVAATVAEFMAAR